MAGFIDALERAILDHVLNDGAYTPPATWYVGLGTTATVPADDGTGFTEVSTSGTAYARQATSGATWNAATGAAPATKSNGVTITFPQATASWGSVGYFGLFTAASGGTPQIWGPLTTPISVGSGSTASFAAGALVARLGDPADSYP